MVTFSETNTNIAYLVALEVKNLFRPLSESDSSQTP